MSTGPGAKLTAGISYESYSIGRKSQEQVCQGVSRKGCRIELKLTSPEQVHGGIKVEITQAAADLRRPRGGEVGAAMRSYSMTQQDNTVRTETSLRIAVKLMLKHRINCLPVVFEDERLCRIVTSTNLPITLPKYIEQRQRNGGCTGVS